MRYTIKNVKKHPTRSLTITADISTDGIEFRNVAAEIVYGYPQWALSPYERNDEAAKVRVSSVMVGATRRSIIRALELRLKEEEVERERKKRIEAETAALQSVEGEIEL